MIGDFTDPDADLEAYGFDERVVAKMSKMRRVMKR